MNYCLLSKSLLALINDSIYYNYYVILLFHEKKDCLIHFETFVFERKIPLTRLQINMFQLQDDSRIPSLKPDSELLVHHNSR